MPTSPLQKQILTALIRPILLVYLSFVLIRVELIRAAGLTLADAARLAVLVGFIYDLGVLAAVTGIANALGAAGGASRRWIVSASWLLLVCAGVANLIYFRFFGTELSLWVISLHWRDTAAVSGSATELGVSAGIVGALALCLWAIFLLSRRRFERTRGRRIPLRAAASLLAGTGGALLLQVPVWLDWVGFQHGQRYGEAKVVGENVIRSWFDSAIEGDKGLRAQALEDRRRMLERGTTPETLLARYRGDAGGTGLRWSFESQGVQSRQLRRELGLPETGPINVIALFLESARAYEFFDPGLSPVVYPEIRRILDRHAIVFEQAYSSSAEAGQTVRGEFSTLCSSLPNFGMPATYLVANQVSTLCLARVFEELGNHSLWINGYERTFHGKEPFERLHGTRTFFDISDFARAGIGVLPGRLGVEDDQVFGKSLELFRAQARNAPFFVNLTTVSTHHPHPEHPEHRLPASLRKRAGGEHHWRYLTQLNAMDRAVATFLRELFADPGLGPNTLVAMLGDHSIEIDSTLPRGEVARYESRFRIPIVLLTRNMKKPRKISAPIHQIDLAPTLAAIAGWNGETTWLGRNVLRGPGSPWVFLDKKGVSYRSDRRLCQTSVAGTRCYEVAKGQDPLFAELRQASHDEAEERFFSDVAVSSRVSIMLNLFKGEPKAPAGNFAERSQ